MVDDNSSTIGTGMEGKGSLHANHIEMAKFSGNQDPNYRRVLAVVDRCIGKLNTAGTV